MGDSGSSTTESFLAEPARHPEEDVQNGAVDEGDTAKIEHDQRPAGGDERFPS